MRRRGTTWRAVVATFALCAAVILAGAAVAVDAEADTSTTPQETSAAVETTAPEVTDEETTGPAETATPEMAAAAAAASAEDPLCVRRINERGSEPKVDVTQPIEFTVKESDPILDFGSSRDTRYDYVVLKASEPIPPGVFSTSFEIDGLEPMRRVGTNGLESTRLRSPTYSRPHFINHRKELAFNLCVSAADGDPGSYTGQFLFVGPGAIASATVPQTARLKAGKIAFWLFLIGVLALTFIFLVVRAYAEFDPKSADRRELLIRVFLLFVSVAAAGAAMYAVYDKNPTWGEDWVISGGALIATGFTAAGVGNTLSGGAEKISETLKKAKEGQQGAKKQSADS